MSIALLQEIILPLKCPSGGIK